MVEFTVPPGSPVVGRSIMQLGLPRGVLIVLISRGEDSIVPNGATVLREDDKLAVLANETDSAELSLPGSLNSAGSPSHTPASCAVPTLISG